MRNKVNGEARLYINDEYVGLLESTKIELCEDGFYNYNAKVREIEREDTIDGLDDFIKAIERNMFREMSLNELMHEASKRLVDGINRNKLNENPLDCLYKKEVEGEWVGNKIDMNKIHNLKCNKDANICDSFLKLNEEYNEVLNAYAKFDKDNLIEELLDVVQMCYGVAYTIDVDLDEHIKEHNEKLLLRGHEFVK